MNFLKKKLKPLTSGFNNHQASSGTNQRGGHQNRNLEDDLYDEYVVEAPPHPSELLALGVEPSEIDINDPDKLRELYRKAKEEGKDKKTNSILLARQRQKEEIEEKKRTREEWKFFDSLTSRVEQVVKESQRNLDHWKESSAISEIVEPDYEIRHTPDEVFRPVTAAKLEKGANEWINFDEDQGVKTSKESGKEVEVTDNEQFDEFGCPSKQRRASSSVNETQNIIVKEILEDFGIDLRTTEQRSRAEERRQKDEETAAKLKAQQQAAATNPIAKTNTKPNSTSNIVARPRPRPRGAKEDEASEISQATNQEPDPFDTSFVAATSEVELDLRVTEVATLEGPKEEPLALEQGQQQAKFVDPFDTSYVNL